MILAQNSPKTAKSQWHCPLKNLENCRLYPLNGFDFIFYCVTMNTLCILVSGETWKFHEVSRVLNRRRHLAIDCRLLWDLLPLCLSRFLFLCFVLQVCLSCFRITLPFLAWLWSKQNRETCLPFWTRSIKPFYVSAGLRGGTWEWVRMLQNGGQASSRGAERTYYIIWLLAKRIKESSRFKILLWLYVVFFKILKCQDNFLSLWKLTYFNVTISHQDLTTSCTINKEMLY